jgi:hypothetical protein
MSDGCHNSLECGDIRMRAACIVNTGEQGLIITREAIIGFWLSELEIEPVPKGCIRLDFSVPPFPDLADLNPQERAAMRDPDCASP